MALVLLTAGANALLAATPADPRSPSLTGELVYDRDYPFIRYSEAPVRNAVARLQQRLATGGSLERQPKEAGQILAKRAVACQHGIEFATLFQPLVGTTIHGGLCQFRGIDCGAERGDSLIAVGINQRVNSAEHATQTVAGLTAQSLSLFLDSVARPPGHAGQEQIIHLDDMVEQKLAGFHQITGDQRVSLGGCEAPEITGIITTAKLTKLLHDARIESIEPGAPMSRPSMRRRRMMSPLMTPALGARG